MRIEPDQDPSDVAEVAIQYLNAKLENVKATVFMVATQIAMEPLVRRGRLTA